MSTIPSDQIDFSKYRRDGLADKIGSLLSIPEALKTILRCGLIAVLLILLPVMGMFVGRAHWAIVLTVFFYASLVSIVLGMLLGMAVTFQRSLGNFQALFEILLEISEQVSDDVGQMRDGSMEIPSPRQIFEGVYQSVFMPTLEGVVRSQAGIFGGLAFRVYRWTLDRVVRRFLSESPSEFDELAESDGQKTLQELESMDDSSQRAARWLRTSRQWVSTLGSTARRIVMWPLWCVLGLSSTAALIPIALVWYFS